MSNTPPVPTGLVKPKPNYLIHSPPSPPTPPRAKPIHISHTPPTPLTRTSSVLDKTPEPHVPLIHALTATTHYPDPTPALPSLSQHTHMQQYMHHSHRNNRTHNIGYYENLTNRPGTTTGLLTPHKPSSKSERNLIILQVNINGLRNKLEELKLLIHDTHTDIITIQETKLTPKAKTPKIHNFTAVRTDKAGGGLITLIRDNITFTTTDIPSTINTHNTELQMVKVHINNTKHITIANIYIPPRDTTSTHYKTADTDIQHCIQYIINIPHSVLTGDVNAHSTLWHSYTDDHRGQLIADVISNSDRITLNTNTPTSVVCLCPLFGVCGCAVSRRYINVCNCDMFSAVDVYLDHLKFCAVCIHGRRYVCCIVNVMLSLMSVMSPSPAFCNLSACTVVKLCTLGVFALRVSLVS